MTMAKRREDGIWYFGYGPIVHPAVRERRKVATSDEQPAILLDHRLTFSYGGIASIIPKCGFDVQGLLMKLRSKEDWERLKEVDSGYDQRRVQVFPYSSSSAVTKEDDDNDRPEFDEGKGILSYVFVMIDFEESILDKPVEKKPQERYLRLISEGMRTYGVNETYIQDEIMSCPYIPKRAPENWYSFPCQSEKLPVVSMKKYVKMCNVKDDLFFILHNYVLKLDPRHGENPAAKWIREHAHGKGDVSFQVHQVVVDPDIPWARNPESMTELHCLWAENHVYELFQQAGFSATKVFRLNTQGSGGIGRWRRSLSRKARTKS